MSLCKVRLNQQLAVYVTALFAMLQLLHLADTAVSKEEHCMMHRATQRLKTVEIARRRRRLQALASQQV